MSGGSWDHVFGHFADVADALANNTSTRDRRPLILTPEQQAARAKLARVISACSTAMHAVEWVDSDDWGTPRDIEAIEALLVECKSLAKPKGRT